MISLAVEDRAFAGRREDARSKNSVRWVVTPETLPTLMLWEKKLHLDLQLPVGPEVRSRRVVQTLNACIHRLIVDLEETADASA